MSRWGLPKAAKRWRDPKERQSMNTRMGLFYLHLGTGREYPFANERTFQSSIISFIDKKYPQIGALCFHVPLELLRHEGKTAAMFSALGARAGVSDLVMLVPRGRYHGLVLELKIAPRQPNEKQIAFLEAARANGYAACWTDSYDSALKLIDVYLALPERAVIAELTPTVQEIPDEFRSRKPAKASKAHRRSANAAVHAADEGAVADGAAPAGQR